MIKTSVRRFTLALVLGVSTLAGFGAAHAQSTPPSGVSTNGVTGTDPVPKGCGCVIEPPADNAASPVYPYGTVAQVLLAFLGVA